jgi:hypothetical protein
MGLLRGLADVDLELLGFASSTGTVGVLLGIVVRELFDAWVLI